ncbi:hypothetical protein KFE25_000747 [Diacronema lutheri]|uniref:Dienelactone hydrolase domain-containing protein n=2 Tax=Diacronema lutheri TaxID=2081491 RepID=A0A8J5XR03_DIALT|nr:hypothetical protein KFE25_000747 [Diacronema lutheri]
MALSSKLNTRAFFAATKSASRNATRVGFGPSKDVPGFAMGPAGAPAVIVVQEWWGVTEQVLDHAGRIATTGFRVLIPDLYKGKIGVDAEEAHHLMGTLDFPKAVGEICDAASFLKAEGAPKVGIVGFCMGGALALGGAAASKDIRCAVPFYGVNFELFTPEQLASKPVCAHFGEADAMAGFADPGAARKLEDMLRKAGNTQSSVTVHPKVGHAFMNDSPAPFASFDERQQKLGFPPYDERTAQAAWSTTLSFLTKHLIFGS